MLMATIASQSQLDYMALQFVVKAMQEIAEKPNEFESSDPTNDPSHENKQKNKLKYRKKGIHQVFDLIAKSHINTRLWLNARIKFVSIMTNQLSDIGRQLRSMRRLFVLTFRFQQAELKVSTRTY